jgi:hypothetical protein
MSCEKLGILWWHALIRVGGNKKITQRPQLAYKYKTSIDSAMKTLILILTLAAQNAYACVDLFQNTSAQELILASEKLDKYFNDDENFFEYTRGEFKKSIKQQKIDNAARLVPYDRAQNSNFLNFASGRVQVRIDGVDGAYEGSAQKISRCHIVTSAHIVYGDTRAKLDASNIRIGFFSGQSCDPLKAYTFSTPALVHFKMTDKSDFRVEGAERRFHTSTDLVILKLKEFDALDARYFKINTTRLNANEGGVKIDCWGFPGFRKKQQLGAYTGGHYLWRQKDARIFGFTEKYGYVSNVVGAHGMSGGGCSIARKGKSESELIAIIAGGYGFNPIDDASELIVSAEDIGEKAGTMLSSFDLLSRRFNKQNKKQIESLDKECDEKD